MPTGRERNIILPVIKYLGKNKNISKSSYSSKSVYKKLRNSSILTL